MLELIGEAELAEGLAEYVISKDAVPIPLSPTQPHKGVRQDMRWRLFPNEKVEPEVTLSHAHNKSTVCSNCGNPLQNEGK
jgi:hypothetical protein